MSPNNESKKDASLQEISDRLSLLEGKLDIFERQNRDMQILLRIIAQPILWTSLANMFTKPQQLWAYELSDGFRSTRDIGKIIGVDQKTVSTWWRTWAEEFDIVEKVGKRGQFKARYGLLELLLLRSPGQVDEN